MGIMGIGGSFPGMKWQKLEAGHSPPSSAEVNNTWIYTSTPPICLQDAVLNELSTRTFYFVSTEY
jgi:hypothetical protein